MKKKCLYMFILFSLIIFIGIKSVSAFTCEYGGYSISFNDESNDNSDTILYINGKAITGDDLNIDFKPGSVDSCPSNIDVKKYGNNISGDKYKVQVVEKDTGYSLTGSSDTKRRSTTYGKVSCGNITGIPAKIPKLVSQFVTLLQIAVPIILVIMGSIDLFKGVIAQKEDEINKGRQIFIKRLIVSFIIFFIVALVKLIISFVADSTSSKNVVDCIDCFISNNC